MTTTSGKQGHGAARGGKYGNSATNHPDAGSDGKNKGDNVAVNEDRHAYDGNPKNKSDGDTGHDNPATFIEPDATSNTAATRDAGAGRRPKRNDTPHTRTDGRGGRKSSVRKERSPGSRVRTQSRRRN
jgi:hypothetical protein